MRFQLTYQSVRVWNIFIQSYKPVVIWIPSEIWPDWYYVWHIVLTPDRATPIPTSRISGCSFPSISQFSYLRFGDHDRYFSKKPVLSLFYLARLPYLYVKSRVLFRAVFVRWVKGCSFLIGLGNLRNKSKLLITVVIKALLSSIMEH